MRDLAAALNSLDPLESALVCARDLDAAFRGARLHKLLSEIEIMFMTVIPKGPKAPKTIKRGIISGLALAAWCEWCSKREWTQQGRADAAELSKRQFQRSYSDLYCAVMDELERRYEDAMLALEEHGYQQEELAAGEDQVFWIGNF